ncbi:hypothetical protein OKW96_16555 [Sphingobacterium sp. KU25419]|nr:hypothetical protein OKW96_16555 [Sphingobacterium sp. KU25419]
MSRSAKAEDVHEFYTAKDFPIETDFTAKKVPVKKRFRTLRAKKEELQVLQGYVLKMNDMHGKPKAVSNYVIKPDDITRELITSTRYNYKVDGLGKLNNRVKAVKRNSLVSPSYSVQDMVLGEETDFTIDSRQRFTESSSLTVSLNLNVVNFAIIVVPIPTVFFPDMDVTALFQTMVSTKIIQQYGILESVEVNDHGAKTKSENILYDSETGQVLLSKVNNEFGDPINNLTYPAYWAYDGMGPSYYNVGYEENFDTVKIDDCLKARLINPANIKHYNVGDELIMQYKTLTPNVGISEKRTVKMYVVGVAPLYAGLNCYTATGTTVLNNCTVVLEPGSSTPTGHPTFGIWEVYGNVLVDVNVKVLRSGRRNNLNSKIQQIRTNGTFTVNSFQDLFSAANLGNMTEGSSRVFNSSIHTFRESGVNQEINEGGLTRSFGLSPYLKGEKGNWREWETYGWSGKRRYENHARKDGVFNSYSPFWAPGTNAADSGTCTLADYILYPRNDWKKIKEVIAYNAYGAPVEEIDAAKIPSTAIYGFNYSLPKAIGLNAKNRQIKFVDFEEEMQVQNYNKYRFGIWAELEPSMLPPFPGVSSYLYNYGKTYWTPNATDFVENAALDRSESHTGNYCLKFNGTANVKIAKVTDYIGVPYCHISAWVKRTGSAPVPNQIRVYVSGKDGNGNPISNVYTVFSQMTNSLDGWYKLEGKMTMNLLAAYTDIHIQAPLGYFIDDIRMLPDGANMKSFVYDSFTSRLLAEMDENNFATFYEYDQEGVLVRVKKETERGILTVNENRKANAKNVH